VSDAGSHDEKATLDQRLMAEALELAARGRGSVEPNPMVGAVIARGEEILGRGWHRRFGGPHAEPEALADASRHGCDVRGATLYVTLEPCCHTNKKTPPCVDAILAAGLGRVVVAMEDPDANVRGRGLERLRSAGVEVSVGAGERATRRLLAPYVKLRTTARPWVIAKWAQTPAGYLALPPGAGRWISNEASRADTHRLRGFCDGILVGAGTVEADDPLLTNRSGQGNQPTRVVLDGRLRISPQSQLALTTAAAGLLVVTTPQALAAAPDQADALRKAGAEVLALAADDRGRIDLDALLDELGRRRWTNLLVEGGREVLAEFLSRGLADELRVYVGSVEAGATTDDQAVANLPRLNVRELPGGRALEVCESAIEGDTLVRAVLNPLGVGQRPA
jgi:diaminohydroxyphosphoribosylaminopyrimidine deaminase/5-amino-6-(5-phosphoribosylamino)uracil reductase